MAIEAVCGSCGRRYLAPDSMAGKRVKCKQCGSIFELPGAEPSDEPDLDSLADLERSHAPMAGGSRHPTASRADTNITQGMVDGAEDDSDDESDDAEEGDEVPIGRRNVRFRYKYSQMLDAWLAPSIVVLGLGWVALAVLRAEDVPNWLVVARVGIVLFLYTIVIAPLTLTGLRMAGRAMRYQLPSQAGWRTFASYMPAFTLGLVMWNVGGGAGIALFLGILLGLGISAAALWGLFRLQPQEIAPSAGYGSGGFLIGTVVTGLIMFGLNTLIVRTLVESKKETTIPASPFGQAFAWVPKPEAPTPTVATHRAPPPGLGTPNSPMIPVPPKVSMAPTTTAIVVATTTPAEPTAVAVTPTPNDPTGEPFPNAKVVPPGDPEPATQPESPTPLVITHHAPTGPKPTPMANSPLIAKLDAAPLEGNFDAFLRPPVKSAFAAVVRAPDGTNVPIELWNTDSYTRKAAATFSNSGAGQDVNFVLSPDGVHLARVAVFPKPSVQIWSFSESRVDRSIDITDPPNAFELIGFISDTRLIARVDTQTTTIRWIDIITKKAKVIDLGTLIPHGSASLATNPVGTTLAAATRFNNEPTIALYTIESGILSRRIKVTALGPNMTVAPTGMSFSPDGTQVAAIFEQDGGALIVTYLVATGKPVGEPKVYPATPIPPRSGQPFNGSSLAWLPDGKAWLLYGDAVIEAASGRIIDRLNVPNVIAQRFPSPDTVELTTQDPTQHERQLLRVKLDTDKISAAEPAK